MKKWCWLDWILVTAIIVMIVLILVYRDTEAGQMLDGMAFYMHKSGGAGDVLPVGAVRFGTEAVTFGAGNFVYFGGAP